MPENNQILSVEGQLVGMPLAGPESFSQQQIDYLKRALGVDETVLWESANGATGFTTTEPIENFERLLIYVHSMGSTAKPAGVIVPMVANNVSGNLIISWTDNYDTNWRLLTWCLTLTRSGNVFSTASNYFMGVNNSGNFNAGQNPNDYRIYKVIGVHRISGGNE